MQKFSELLFVANCSSFSLVSKFAPFIFSFRCPVFIIHGTADRIVPFWHGQKLLYSVPPCCRTKPLFISGMGHNHVNVTLRPLVAERLMEFLCKYVLTGAANEISTGHGSRISKFSDAELTEITYPSRYISTAGLIQ